MADVGVPGDTRLWVPVEQMEARQGRTPFEERFFDALWVACPDYRIHVEELVAADAGAVVIRVRQDPVSRTRAARWSYWWLVIGSGKTLDIYETEKKALDAVELRE